MPIFLKKLRKEILFRTPLRKYFLYRNEFMLTPSQLMVLCNHLAATKDVPGSIVEIGCAYGMTTVFLDRYLRELNSDKKYYCIDTFGGFESSDIAVERTERGKGQEDFSAFQVNDKSWFDETMRINYVERVTSFKADAKTFDYAALKPISFCLLDVDIYQPTKIALEKLWPLMSPGGVIVIDDCRPSKNFDGALQAYTEFCQTRNLSVDIAANKLGILNK
jgi:hypothetical protein